MKNLLLGIIIIVAIGLIVFSRSDSDQNISNGETSEAFSFSLENYDGEMVTIADFEEKILVVNSWASWCPFCVKELPDFALLQEEFEGRIKVIAVNRQEPLTVAKSYTDGQGTTDALVYLLDPQDSFYRSIGGFSMPETIFLNAERKIIFHKRGPMDLDEMRDRTLEILNKD